MKIFDAEQIRDWDAFTIKNEPISSIDLMERAAAQCTRWLVNRYTRKTKFLVLCGPGNNGGDGLVIARQLSQMFFGLRCTIIEFSKNYSPDFTHNKKLLELLGVVPEVITSEDDLVELYSDKETVIIDAIFGSGLNRPAEGLAALVIQWINQTSSEVVSIDLPSGMFCEDNSKNIAGCIVHATDTLSFQVYKLGFLLPECGSFAGNVQILPIGLSREYEKITETTYYVLSKEMLASIKRERARFTHKGTYGHALLIAGSSGKMGAAVLTTKACVNAGAGLVTSHIPLCGTEIMQSGVAEAMVLQNQGEYELSGNWDNSNTTIGIGPGVGQSEATTQFLDSVLNAQRTPMVVDADALNIISKNSSLRKKIPAGSILTPHPKEFSRLAGTWDSDIQKLALLRKTAQELNTIIILKGAHTAVAKPDGGVYFNITGNPGMATGGSGDVLTGVVTSFLAQGYNSFEAACLGVYVHGLAGDLAAHNSGTTLMSAGDIIDCLPRAIAHI